MKNNIANFDLFATKFHITFFVHNVLELILAFNMPKQINDTILCHPETRRFLQKHVDKEQSTYKFLIKIVNKSLGTTHGLAAWYKVSKRARILHDKANYSF